MKFTNIILFFVVWVAVVTAVFYALIALNWPRALMLIPAVGGLGYFFYLNRK